MVGRHPRVCPMGSDSDTIDPVACPFVCELWAIHTIVSKTWPPCMDCVTRRKGAHRSEHAFRCGSIHAVEQCIAMVSCSKVYPQGQRGHAWHPDCIHQHASDVINLCVACDNVSAKVYVQQPC